MRRHRTVRYAVCALTVLVGGHAYGQDRRQTQAFKTDRPAMTPPLVYPWSSDAQMLEAFVLMQEANAGKPSAQHELGIRHLLGRGFPPDTVRAAFWIRKAADRGLPIAQYNLGIFEANGWGTDWDPFAAYRDYRAAASGGMKEALYIMGLIYGENFVVPRNWPVAYGYFKQAADQGFEPARLALAELVRRGYDQIAPADSIVRGKEPVAKEPTRAAADTTFNFVFVDFVADTVTTIPDTTLLRDALKSLRRNDDLDDGETLAPVDSTLRRRMFRAAEHANPEALCLVGRLFERGVGVPKDAVLAGVYYLRALRLESSRAPGLLWKLTQSNDFLRGLKARSEAGEGDALFVWAGLTATKFSGLLSDKQALQLLERAASAGHIPSIIELGFCALTGRWLPQDRSDAERRWTQAAARGSIEAHVRLAVTDILTGVPSGNLRRTIALLDSTAAEGSLLSDVALAYCMERGIGKQQNKGEAYRIYHRSMRRGSETAYRALRRMHDEIRPPEKEFQVTE